MWLITAIVSGALHVGYTVFRDSVNRGGDPIYSVLAESLLVFTFLILFVAVWKFYCNEWRQLSGRSVIRVVAEKVWLPFIAVFLITEPRYFFPERMEMGVVVTGVALFIALVDWDQSIQKVVETFSARHQTVTDRRMLYSHYPPRKRSDLLPMDILFNVATFAMIIKKIT